MFLNSNFFSIYSSLLEGVNLFVSSGTASAIAGDRLCLVTRKTARHNDTKVREKKNAPNMRYVLPMKIGESTGHRQTPDPGSLG